jgi:hypothetical protein
MKSANEITDEVIEVALDLTIDIFSILVKENIPHKVLRALADQSKLFIQIRINHKSELEMGALENIKTMLTEYYIWRYDENNEIDWRN